MLLSGLRSVPFDTILVLLFHVFLVREVLGKSIIDIIYQSFSLIRQSPLPIKLKELKVAIHRSSTITRRIGKLGLDLLSVPSDHAQVDLLLIFLLHIHW